jgi:DNA primase
MTQQWIDFKALREQLDFALVLKHYNVELKRKGKDQLGGFCPLPNHNGQRKSASFSANLERKIFKCFGCQRGGNVLDFAIYMEGKDPENRRDVRDVALMLQERFGLSAGKADKPAGKDARPNPPQSPQSQRTDSDREGRAHENAERADTRPAVIVNAPLDFQLKGLDANHPYLRERGFTDETILHFGLGFCNRGLMQGRVVIPLRDDCGNLIGYAGRFTRDDQVGEGVPKYLFPSNRERNGTVYEFRKNLFLYNRDAIRDPVRDLYVVEGFPSVWWLWQCGFKDAIAVMGSSCSSEQAELILRSVSVSGRVWLLPDAGEGGKRCAESLLMQVSPHRFCRWVKFDEGQPTDLSPDALVKLLEWRVTP